MKEKVSTKSKALSFKRWENKKYSIFRSLGKVIRIGVLTFSYLGISCFNSFSQTDTININDINITATRAAQTIAETAKIVTIISKNELADKPFHSVEELLKIVSDVDVRQRGIDGVQSDVSLRGGTFEQTLVLINGININDPQTGHHNFNLPIDLESIERIEVLQGPAARIYGPNAFNGAINIITKNEAQNNLQVSASSGSYSYYGLGISGAFGSNDFRNNFSISTRHSDGYIKDTDYDIAQFFYNPQFKIGKLNFQAMYGFTEKAYGAWNFYSVVFPNEYETTRTNLASLRIDATRILPVTLNIYWRQNSDKFELFRNEQPSWYTKDNYNLTDVFGVDLNSNFKTVLGKTSVGLSLRSENILSNNLGDSLSTPQDIGNGFAGKYYLGAHRFSTNVFVEHNITFQQLYLSAGLLVNNTQRYGTNIYPGLDVGYHISSNLQFFASVNKSLRVPTFTELYYSDPSNVGNKNLKPETAIASEFGLKYNDRFIVASASYFIRNGSNIIDWVRADSKLVWTCQNITDVKTNGIEINSTFFPANLNQTLEFIHYIKISYSWLDISKQSGNYFSAYALDYLKNKIDVQLAHQIYKNFGAEYSLSQQIRTGTYTDGFGVNHNFDPVTLINARLFLNLPKVNFYLEGKNLMNKKYFDFGNIEMPGLTIKGGVVFKLNF